MVSGTRRSLMPRAALDVKAFQAHAGRLEGPGAQGIKTGFAAAREHFHGQIRRTRVERREDRSEEHTSELQSPCNLVCCLLLGKRYLRISAIDRPPRFAVQRGSVLFGGSL